MTTARPADDAEALAPDVDPPEVDVDRAAAHAVLVDTITATRRPPCVRWPDAGWISEDRTTQLDAAALCDHCHALAACSAYIAEHLEPSGVWAGTVPPTYPGGPRSHHTLERPTLPPDLDPGRPLDALPTHALVTLTHALAARGMPARTIARLLRRTRHTIARYLSAPPTLTTSADASRLANDIRTAASAAHAEDDGAALAELVRLAEHARDVDAHLAAGHPNWTSYLAAALAGDAPPANRRRPLALALVDRGLSTRAAGALVGASYGAVGRWMRERPFPPTP